MAKEQCLLMFDTGVKCNAITISLNYYLNKCYLLLLLFQVFILVIQSFYVLWSVFVAHNECCAEHIIGIQLILIIC